MPKIPASLKSLETFLSKNEIEQFIPMTKSFDNIGKKMIGEDGYSSLQGMSNGLVKGLMSGNILDGVVSEIAIGNENKFAMKLKENYPKIKNKFSELLNTKDNYTNEIIAAFNPKFPENNIREVLTALFKYLQRDDIKKKFAKKQQERLDENANASIDAGDKSTGGNGEADDNKPCSNCSDKPITLETPPEPTNENEPPPEDKLLEEFTFHAYNRFCCKLNDEIEINDLIAYYETFIIDIFALKINDLLKNDMEAVVNFTTKTNGRDGGGSNIDSSGISGGIGSSGSFTSMLKKSAQSLKNNPNIKKIGSNLTTDISQKLTPTNENIGALIKNVKSNSDGDKINISDLVNSVTKTSNNDGANSTNNLGNQLNAFFNTGKPISQNDIDKFINTATTSALSTVENFIANNKSKIADASTEQIDVVKKDVQKKISSFVDSYLVDKYKNVLQGLLNGEISKTSKRLADKLHTLTYTIFDDYYPHAMIDTLLMKYFVDTLTDGRQSVQKSNIYDEPPSPEPISGGLSSNLAELETQAEVVEYILRDINTTFCKKIIENLENTANEYNRFVTSKMNEIMTDVFRNKTVGGATKKKRKRTMKNIEVSNKTTRKWRQLLY